jgi:CPA2 family monovalent cation:H+ antiporter-2
MHDLTIITTLAGGLAVALVLGWMTQRLGLSTLVGYMLAGIVVGPYTPGFVADAGLASQMAEIGVILLMFGVGMHFHPQELLRVWRIAVPGAVAQSAVAAVAGWAAARWFGWSHGAGIVFGLALSVASTVVLLRALEERRLVETTRGRIAVGWLIVEDLAMVLALVLLPALADALGGQSGSAGGDVVWSLAITLGKVAAFVVLMLVVGRRAIPWILERSAGTGSRELFTLAVLAIALGVAFGAAALFGVSFALGAFFAGMLLNESKLSHEAASDSLPLRDAFAVLFFVSVGMLFDPAILVREPIPVLATFLIIVLGKSIAAYLIVKAFRHPPGTSLTIAASLAQIGEFSFILAGLGVGLEILPIEGQDLILAGALLSIVVNPLIFVALDRWQARESAREDAAHAPVPEPPPGPILEGEHHAILVGYGRVGRQLALLLRQRGVPLMIVDDDPDLVARAHDDGLPAIRGNAAADRVLQEARPQDATLAVIAIPNALEAGEIVAKLRAANAGLTIFARAHGDDQVRHLLEHGADGAVMAERELAYSMAEMVMATPRYRAARVETA